MRRYKLYRRIKKRKQKQKKNRVRLYKKAYHFKKDLEY